MSIELEAGNGGAIVMFMLPEELAAKLMEWGKQNVPDEAVFSEPGKGRECSPHVTLYNGVTEEDPAVIDDVLGGLCPCEATLGPLSVFKDPEKPYDVLHVQLISDELDGINGDLADKLEVNEPMHDFNPHATIAYVQRGSCDRFDGIDAFKGQKACVDNVTYSGGGHERKTVPLKGAKKDKLSGGKADGIPYEDFDQGALEKGTKVEMEHTDDPELAREVASDHLAEFPTYYEALEEMEGKLKMAHASAGTSVEPQAAPQGTREPLKESLDYQDSLQRFIAAADAVEQVLFDSGIPDASEHVASLKNLVFDITKQGKR